MKDHKSRLHFPHFDWQHKEFSNKQIDNGTNSDWSVLWNGKDATDFTFLTAYISQIIGKSGHI